MIKGFLFDLDGVIAQTDEFHYLAWKKEVAKIGIIYSRKENASLKGLSRENTLKAILKNHNLNNIDNDEIIKIANSKNQYYIQLLNEKLSKKNILPGVIDFLKEIKKKGIKMAITSSSRNALLILTKLDLIKYFDYIVDPKNVKNGKPAPDIYILGAKGLKINYENLVGFEDAILGIEGLHKAKIKSVAITNGEKLDWSKADIILETTKMLNLNKILNIFNN